MTNGYVKDSNLYISIGGNSNMFDTKTRKEIDNTFEEIFENSFTKLSDIQVDSESEIIYEIMVPAINDENLIMSFLKKTERLLEELSDFNPYFTQYERGDN